jgi:hypothetical protein
MQNNDEKEIMVTFDISLSDPYLKTILCNLEELQVCLKKGIVQKKDLKHLVVLENLNMEVDRIEKKREYLADLMRLCPLLKRREAMEILDIFLVEYKIPDDYSEFLSFVYQLNNDMDYWLFLTNQDKWNRLHSK